MSEETVTCPRRGEGPAGAMFPGPDRWREVGNDRTCSFCGSCHPDDFLAVCKEAADPASPTRVSMSDKRYKIYLYREGVSNASDGAIKFYVMHFLSDEAFDAAKPEINEALKVSRVKFASYLEKTSARFHRDAEEKRNAENGS